MVDIFSSSLFVFVVFMNSFLTGIQPSGILHIGNYFGSILPNLEMSEQAEKSIVMIVDLHALTSLQDKDALKTYTQDLAMSLLACGLNPEKTLMFRQSDVSAHAELTWILSNIAPMGLLERAHAYKDKVGNGISPNVGLFTYPILMAADILLYGPDAVPVGKDQKQHLEIARDLAQKFNTTFGGETLKLPEPIISESTGVIPGIDGEKMSKSYGNTIPLFPKSEKELKKRIMQIVTDSKEVAEPKDPDSCNIFALSTLFLSGADLENLRDKYVSGGMGYGDAKTVLFDAMVQRFKPMWEKKAELKKTPEKVEEVLQHSAEVANRVANRTLEKVYKKVGLR